MPRFAPSIGAASIEPRPDSPAATIQLSRESRRTGMPSSRARSLESAAPRTAMPRSVRPKNHASPARTATTEPMAAMWSPVKTMGPTVTLTWNGVVKVARGFRSENRGGRMIWTAPMSWATPSVATVSSRRGAVKNRRTTTRSTSAPVAIAATRPMGTATRYGSPTPATVMMATEPASPPISAWAKLMTLVAR